MIPVLIGLGILTIALVVGSYKLDQAKARDKAPEAAKPMYDMLGLWATQGLPGAPVTDSEYATQSYNMIQNWAINKGLPLSLLLPGRSPVSPAEAPAEASRIIDKGLSLITVLNSAGVVAEAASLGQMESVIWAMMNVINASGLPSVISDLYKTPVDIGLKIPLERRMLRDYQPRIPEPDALLQLRAKDLITGEAFYFWMSEHGYPDWACDVMAGSLYTAPDIETCLTLLRRGIVDAWTFKRLLGRRNYESWQQNALLSLQWQLPGYADMISVYMREGYLEEKWVECPTEFLDYMKSLGYDTHWALRLWGKHWILPGVNLLYDMLHKGIIDYDTMVQMLRYHDFEPVWRDRLIANAWNMIPRVDLRRAYRYNLIGAEGLAQRYGWLGFKPSDAEIMARIAERSSLDRYYTRLETVARAAYRKGKISRETLIEILSRVQTPAPAVDLVLEAETIAKDAGVLEIAEEPRILSVSQVLRAYEARIMDRSAAESRLKALGFEPEDIQLLLLMSEPAPVRPEIHTELISAASMLYRQGLMDPEEFKGRLRQAGLTAAEIQDKVEAEDLRYRLDYAADLIALYREAFRKDVYTAEEFSARLLYYGMQPERVSALVALEELRKLPKPKVAG